MPGLWLCRISNERWEMQFATNFLGHFALTTGLHAALAAASGARIVSVSSSANMIAPVFFDDPHFNFIPYNPWLAYGQSKTANVLMAVETTRRWANAGIFANALNPGAIPTNLQRHVGGINRDGPVVRGPNGVRCHTAIREALLPARAAVRVTLEPMRNGPGKLSHGGSAATRTTTGLVPSSKVAANPRWFASRSGREIVYLPIVYRLRNPRRHTRCRVLPELRARVTPPLRATSVPCAASR
jgi:NAD(P)-dependent dehydrogenase (short-subunit alcohol dehydrogenase family)